MQLACCCLFWAVVRELRFASRGPSVVVAVCLSLLPSQPAGPQPGARSAGTASWVRPVCISRIPGSLQHFLIRDAYPVLGSSTMEVAALSKHGPHSVLNLRKPRRLRAKASALQSSSQSVAAGRCANLLLSPFSFCIVACAKLFTTVCSRRSNEEVVEWLAQRALSAATALGTTKGPGQRCALGARDSPSVRLAHAKSERQQATCAYRTLPVFAAAASSGSPAAPAAANRQSPSTSSRPSTRLLRASSPLSSRWTGAP